MKPLSFRTNCSEASRISSSVTGGSKLKRVLIFRHMLQQYVVLFLQVEEAPGTTRNQFRLPSIVTLDPRISREIPFRATRIQLIWEAFNLLNRDNINSVDTTFYSVVGTTLTPGTTFGRPLSSAGERIMQLAVKVNF